MSKVRIWHNPRCGKSREALKFLEEEGIDAEVIKYLDAPHTKDEITTLVKMLKIKSAGDLMRTKESIYKELNLKDEKDEEKLIEAMIKYPKLIERPIVIKGTKAVIGRPLEKIVDFIRG